MATLISVVGQASEIAPANGRTFTLLELQGYVGGYIEALRAPDGRLAFLNEDGKRLGLALNRAATELFRFIIHPDDVIVGNVILCSPIEAGEGEDDDTEDALECL